MADYNNTINSDNNNNDNNNIDISALLQSSSVLHSAVPKHPLESFFLSDSLFDSRSVVSFRLFNHGEAGDEEFSEYFHQPEKKRRLTEKQVQFLEKSFEFENKLEPERKIQLAKDIGLQPRQVAIWFQNRRARWKSKQLEMDFDALQASYDSLKTNYVSLLKEKDKLKAKVLDLTEKLRLRGEGDSAVFDAKKISQELPPKAIANLASESEVLMNSTEVCNLEEFGPAESDIFDTGNPHYAIGFHSSLLDPDHSSYAFEPDQSDVSQDEDDPLNRSLMPEYIFPKIEDVDYSDPPTNSCNFDFPADDQPFWPWS